jgi:hypothetical protein
MKPILNTAVNATKSGDLRHMTHGSKRRTNWLKLRQAGGACRRHRRRAHRHAKAEETAGSGTMPKHVASRFASSSTDGRVRQKHGKLQMAARLQLTLANGFRGLFIVHPATERWKVAASVL